MKDPILRPILDFCEGLLDEHGDSPRGMGWTPEDAHVRYGVMLGLIRPTADPVSLLDFGCGTAGLLEHMQRRGMKGVEYHGLDASARAVALCESKFPQHPFLSLDVLAPDAPPWPEYDYVVMNGVFTYKGSLGHNEMSRYCRELLREVFAHARIGLAFNVMSKQVDWEREDLFHAPMDDLVEFLSRELSRHLVVRHDYGLYEYTVYVYREVSPGGLPGARSRVGARR